MMGRRIRILIVDDHPVVLKGLNAILNLEPDIEIVGCASTGAQAITMFRETEPDVTLMDITLGSPIDGIEATLTIRHEFPDARIVMLTVDKSESSIRRALKAGAVTYLLKETLCDDLVATVREVHTGKQPFPPEVVVIIARKIGLPRLTMRECEVMQLVGSGFRNKEVGGRLNISKQTVDRHIRNIFSKLKVNDRTKAATLCIRLGLIKIDGGQD